ncbi:MAG TPA: acetate kinase, partial [Terriglobia bacterium]|nr:acetate kinase [Terriglobia bacterium]
MKILALNSGSSSQKTCLYEIGETLPADPPDRLWEGKIEWQGEDAMAVIKNSGRVSRQDRVKAPSRAQAVERLLSAAWGGETRALV